MKIKRIIALSLAAALVIPNIAGCGLRKKTQVSEIKMYFTGSNVTYDADVLAELNPYLEGKIGVHLKPIWGTWGNFGLNSMLALQGGDDIDLYFTSAFTTDEYNRFARKGYWQRLDDPDNNLLEKYAPSLIESLPEPLVEGATVEGPKGRGIYAIPACRGVSYSLGWDINKGRLAEIGYTPEDIEKLDYYSLEPVLKAAKEKFGDDFYPLVMNTTVAERMVNRQSVIVGGAGADRLFSSFLNENDYSEPDEKYGTAIYNKFETPEFERYIRQSREYYLAGYIDPAMGNSGQASATITAKRSAGDYLLNVAVVGMGFDKSESQSRGYEVGMAEMFGPYVDTNAVQGSSMAVSVYSKHKDKAVELLDLLNSDPKAITLLTYGIEGVHYTRDEDGLIDFTDARKRYSPWMGGMGNVYILPETKAQGKGWSQRSKEVESKTASVPLLGFAFDTTNVETEMGAIANITNEFLISLCSGTVDPDTALPECRDKLKKAGVDRVIEEANRQVEEFLAVKNSGTQQ